MDHMTMRERLQARSRHVVDRRWYEIRNQSGADTTVVRIYDHIDALGVTADDFAADLAEVSTPNIEVQINSPGGLVFDGLAIYNTLRSHPAYVTTRVDGIAASAASVVAQAGDRRLIVESAQTMIHQAWGAAVGPASDMREMADILDKQTDIIARIYAAKSHHDAGYFLDQLHTGDTWLTDQETLDLGLADDIYRPHGGGPVDESTRVSTRQAAELLAAFTITRGTTRHPGG